MSYAADIADSATSVQRMLTEAEKRISGQLPLGAQLPEWYTNLRNQIHGLIISAAWAVGEDDGGSLIGLRCEGRTHSEDCREYRKNPVDHDISPLVACPKCSAEVHSLFDAGPQPYGCWPCYQESKKA